MTAGILSVNLWMCFFWDRSGAGVAMHSLGAPGDGCLVLGSGQHSLCPTGPWLFSQAATIAMPFSAVCFTLSVLNRKWIFFPHGLEVSKHRKEQTGISVRIPRGLSLCSLVVELGAIKTSALLWL